MQVEKLSKLQDYVRVYPNFLTESQSQIIISESEKLDWKLHAWGEYINGSPSPTPNEDFYRVNVNRSFKINLLLNQAINHALSLYTHELDGNCQINGISHIQLNRYDAGTRMHKHVDHIYSCFDGEKRGIPVLTILGLLHSNFKGGEFTICNNYVPEYNCGDIIIFPSLFLYPHEVATVTEGQRFSFVAWAY